MIIENIDIQLQTPNGSFFTGTGNLEIFADRMVFHCDSHVKIDLENRVATIDNGEVEIVLHFDAFHIHYND